MQNPGPAASGSQFVVHTDRPAIQRRHGGILVLHGAITVAIVLLMVWVSGLGLGLAPALPFLLLLVLEIFQLSYHAYVYGTRVAISEPLTLTHHGFTLNTAAGRMEVPWEAVATVRVRRRFRSNLLVIGLHPAVVPSSPGVQTDIDPSYWSRMMKIGGPMLGEKGIRESFDQIKQAVTHFSQGRVPIG